MISSLSVPEQHSEADGSTYLPPRKTRRRWRQYKSSTPSTENPGIWVQLGCNNTSREFLRAPRVAIGAVKLQTVASGRWTVTAEVASSSLVVPAILSKELTESSSFSRGHKKAQNRYRKRALAKQSSRLLHFLRAQERDHGILCIAFLSRYRLSVLIERHANRGVTQQFRHDFQSGAGRSKERRIRVTESMPANSFGDSQLPRNGENMTLHDLLC